MKKKGLCFILAALLCLSFAACDTSSSSQKGEENKAAEETRQPVKEKVFKTSDQMFQITADEDWTDTDESLNIQDAVLTVSKGAEGYIALISEYKYNFSTDLSGYNKMVVKHMEKSVAEDSSSESETLKLGNYDAFKTTMTGLVEGEAETYEIYCAETDNYYVQLICWSASEKQDEFAVEFDKIAHSLQPAETTEE